MRRVCRTWRHATENPVSTDGRFRPRNWILLHPVLPEYDNALTAPSASPRSQTLCWFLNFLTGDRVLVDIPQLRGHRIHACIGGLLLVSKVAVSETNFGGSDVPTWLLNPFTGAVSDYPALLQLLSQWTFVSIGFASSTASCLVMVTRNKVAYVVPGSKEPKLIANHNPYGAINLAQAFFQHCNYVFSITRTKKCIELCLTRFKMEKAHNDQVEFGTERLVIAQRDLARHIGWNIVSLVESDGEFLLLSRSPQSGSSDFFRVFKVVFEEGVGGNAKANLVPLNNIGKHALFINRAYGCISVSTNVYPSLKPNSIYFYHASLLTIYHPGGPHSVYIDPCIAPPGYCYWPVEKSEFTGKTISVFPDFPSRLGKRRRTER